MNIWLVGKAKTLPTKGLPSVVDVLRGYYYYHLELKNVKQTSIILLAKELIHVWKKEEKVTSDQKNIVRKIGKLVTKFELLKKGKTRRSKVQIYKETQWKKNFKIRFDIAPIVKQVIKKPLHIKKGFVYISDDEIAGSSNSTDCDSCSISEDSDADDGDADDTDYCNNLTAYHKKQIIEPVQSTTSVLTKIINSPDVSSALDRTNIENGKFAIVAAAIGRACGDDISKEIFSVSTLKRRRDKHRTNLASSIRNEFDQQQKKSLVVHWDGKKLHDVTNPDGACRDNKVERIAIVVNGVNVNKIIKVSRAENGKGCLTSDLVYETLNDHHVLDDVIGMCTDTTNTNTGNKNGACVLFEKKVDRPLLYFACEHHVHEIVLGGVYVELMGETDGPEEAHFKVLKTEWTKLENRNDYKAIDEKVFKKSKLRCELRAEVKMFLLSILSNTKGDGYFPQDNYRELCELSLILMGHAIPNYVLKKPGACHKARWMVPAIYSLKLYLLRESFDLSLEEEESLKEFCLFVCLVYVKSWFQCQITTNAPKNTLEFYKKLFHYSKINKTVATKAISKLQNHLWYIGSEMICLSLFSSDVIPSEKQNIFDQMVLKDEGWSERNLRLTDLKNLHKKQLHQLVGPSSLSALKSLRVDIKFMFDYGAAEWNSLKEYQNAKEVVDSLKVVNDVAERALKLMTDVNGKLTKNETTTQALIQVIHDHRKRVSSTKKTDLSSYERR